MDLTKNRLPLNARQVSPGNMPMGFGLTFPGWPGSILRVDLRRSIIEDLNPMIENPPAFSSLLHGIAGPHLGPRQRHLAY